jgi:pimeloyl-ACP methyl ester carboxylesterase
VSDTEDRPDVGLVLVAGAELGAWTWERLTDHLDVPAVAVDLPGRGARPAPGRDVHLADAVAAVVADADTLPVDRVVVVAHSCRTALLPDVAAALGDRLAAVVALGAPVPPDGGAWADLLPRAQRLLLRLLARVRPDGVVSPESANRRGLCHDLDAEATRRVLADRVAEPPGPLLERPVTHGLPEGVPLHVVRLLDDRSGAPAIPPLGATGPATGGSAARHHELAGGHLPMLARPADLAALLAGVVAEVAAPSRPGPQPGP